MVHGVAQRSLKKRCPLLAGWGYPPALKIPQDWGLRGLKKTFSEISLSRLDSQVPQVCYRVGSPWAVSFSAKRIWKRAYRKD